MLPQYRLRNRAKLYYAMILTLPVFVLCSTVTHAVLFNGKEWSTKFDARDSNGGLLDPIVKTYYLYLLPPPVGHPEYDAWPVKTQIHGLAVPFLQLKSADFTESEAQAIERQHEWFDVPLLAGANQVTAPSAVRNCFAFGVGVHDYWVNSLVPYTVVIDNIPGDYVSTWWPPSVTHLTHGGGPGNLAHVSKVMDRGWWLPLLYATWTFAGKFGEGGIYIPEFQLIFIH